MTDTTGDPPFLSIEWHCARAARDARRTALEEAAKVAEGSVLYSSTAAAPDPMPCTPAQIAAAIRALIDREPEPVVDGWRDIATAPKDGTSILVWADGYDRPEVVRWAVRRGVGGWLGGDNSIFDDTPTHWMPLPQPPEVKP